MPCGRDLFGVPKRKDQPGSGRCEPERWVLPVIAPLPPLLICVLSVVLVITFARRKARQQQAKWARLVETGRPPVLTSSTAFRYHLFLSHTWYPHAPLRLSNFNAVCGCGCRVWLMWLSCVVAVVVCVWIGVDCRLFRSLSRG